MNKDKIIINSFNDVPPKVLFSRPEKIYSKFNSSHRYKQASKQASKQYLSKKFSRFAALEIPAFKDCVTIKKDIRIANFNGIVPKHFSALDIVYVKGFILGGL